MKTRFILFLVVVMTSCHSYINFPSTHQITGFAEKGETQLGANLTPGYGGDVFFAHAASNHVGFTALMSQKRTAFRNDTTKFYSYELGLLYFKDFKPIRFENAMGASYSKFNIKSLTNVIDPTDDRIFLGNILGAHIQPSVTVDFKFLEMSFSSKLRYMHLTNIEGNLGGSLRGFSIPEVQRYNKNHLILEPGLTLTYKYKGFRLMFQGVIDIYLSKKVYLHGKEVGPIGFGGISYTF